MDWPAQAQETSPALRIIPIGDGFPSQINMGIHIALVKTFRESAKSRLPTLAG